MTMRFSVCGIANQCSGKSGSGNRPKPSRAAGGNGRVPVLDAGLVVSRFMPMRWHQRQSTWACTRLTGPCQEAEGMARPSGGCSRE